MHHLGSASSTPRGPSAADRVMLGIGGGLSAAMAAFHFFLPSVFGWGAEVVHVHPTVRWALFSLNVFFSTLLLVQGFTLLLGLAKRRTHEWTYRAVLMGAVVFWLVNGVYQVVIPMPMPHRLLLLALFLRSYSFGVALLCALPLLRGSRPATTAAGE